MASTSRCKYPQRLGMALLPNNATNVLPQSGQSSAWLQLQVYLRPIALGLHYYQYGKWLIDDFSVENIGDQTENRTNDKNET